MSADRSAIVLAGGRGSRLGGVDKAGVELGGKALVDHVLGALAGCHPVVVVGPAWLARPGVALVREDPPFGGPVAALAAALPLLTPPASDAEAGASGTAPFADDAETWLLACDLPYAERLLQWLDGQPIPPGADALVPVDGEGRPQWLAARYRLAPLARALSALGQAEGAALRQVTSALSVHFVPDPEGLTLDLDTWPDVERVRAIQQEPLRDKERTMPETPADLDAWVVELATALGVDGSAVPTGLLLDLTRDAAHGITRPAGPLTTYLVGLAVAGGTTPEDAAVTVRELIARHSQ